MTRFDQRFFVHSVSFSFYSCIFQLDFYWMWGPTTLPGRGRASEGIPGRGPTGGGVLVYYNTTRIGKWGTNRASGVVW